jgi:hypothetical protein
LKEVAANITDESGAGEVETGFIWRLAESCTQPLDGALINIPHFVTS